MNKKFLICGALAMGLVLTACVKKEEPKDEQQTEASSAASETTEQAQFQPLEASQPEAEVVIPTQVEVVREQTANTTTEVRREVREEQPKPAATQQPAEPKTEDKPVATQQPTKPTSSPQTEDDAVAAAIAAATPALDNK